MTVSWWPLIHCVHSSLLTEQIKHALTSYNEFLLPTVHLVEFVLQLFVEMCYKIAEGSIVCHG